MQKKTEVEKAKGVETLESAKKNDLLCLKTKVEKISR